MYGYDAVLAAFRAQARNIIAAARTHGERAKLQKAYAECVLRNRAKLVIVRLAQTGDEMTRRRIFIQALLGA